MMMNKIIRHENKDLKIYTRVGKKDIGPYEKPIILPALDNNDVSLHTWADARFAVDIMMEHALFFTLLIPKEIAKEENTEAVHFHKSFTKLLKKIDKAKPPRQDDLRSFTKEVIDNIDPFVEYKARLGDAQRKSTLRSLVWPLFFHHTQQEAERWKRRLTKLGKGKCDFNRKEVITFWADIVDEHARFHAHLLDPDEHDLIKEALKTSEIFTTIKKENENNTLSYINSQETNAILEAAERVLDTETKNVRDIETARIKSIIDPRLADHNRRETLKFIDELKRAV
jgi:hypothetical protein